MCWFSLKLTQLSRAVKKSRDFSNTILQAFPSSRLGPLFQLEPFLGGNPGTLRSPPWTTAQTGYLALKGSGSNLVLVRPALATFGSGSA